MISAWARTRKFGKAARARAILTKMKELNKAGVISAKPNAYCYTTVINSCAYCERDSIDQGQALRIAIETYKEMLGEEDEGPNAVTFSTLLTAFRNLMPPDETRAQAVGAVFKKCTNDGYVSDLVLRRLQSSVSRDYLEKLVGKDAILPDGSVDIAAIPPKWVRQGEAQRSSSSKQLA